MTSKRIAQTNGQQKSEKSQESGILQRAAVRSVADAGVQSTEDKEAQPLSNLALSKDFSRVPISTTKPQPIMAKLMIGPAGDKYEQEADRVAAQVVQRINAPAFVHSGKDETVQRQEMETKNNEARLMRSPILQRRSSDGGMAATPDLEASINRARGSGRPMENNVRKRMEQGFGADFSGVKIHTNAQANQLNQSIQARAFTTGQNVFFRQGEYNPGSQGGQELLAHELTHVVQQNGEGNAVQGKSFCSSQIQRNGDGSDQEPSEGSLRPALGKELMRTMYGPNWFAKGVFKAMNFAMYVEGQELTKEHNNVLEDSLIKNKKGVLDTLIAENPHVMKSTGKTPIYLLGKYAVHKPLEYYLKNQEKK
ncbi:MAG: DUF4157 domain-containing protein [Nostoc sp. ChiSLP02]|nr:DUF4157 domain-containing protein [Nostoc sp. DedSLP05]MDZ8101664.1 DUF4157 domain-containing protein [Nostoc sp. DedSLP01]MDZ8188798.1 DUF4157 domain-containing protein [Nostoc sp. ChiSLP02]